MKARSLLSMAMALFILVAPWSALAQSKKASANTDDLLKNIKRMEAMDLSSMSPSTLEIYKRALLRLYESALVPLQQQIDVLADIQAASEANDTEAANAREKLSTEKKQIVDKISILRQNLGLAEGRSVAAAEAGADSEARGVTPVASSSTDRLETSPLPTDRPGPSPATSPAATPPQATMTCATKNFSPIVTDEVNRLARSILINEGSLQDKAAQITSERYPLIFYTIADALKVQVTVPLKTDATGATVSKTISIGELEPYKYLGETLRTDKQFGSSASAASVGAIDKPGFAWLLGFAVENGQVEKSVRDSVLTLSTSPAALFMLNKNDSGNAYQNAGILNRFGASASFNISKQDQLLGNATRSQLREYSIKYRFAGDRSPRSKKLEAIWDEVAGDIQERLIAINSASEFINKDPILDPLTKKANAELQTAVVSKMASNDFKKNINADGTFTDAAVCQLSDTILDYLSTNVSSQKDKLSPGAINQFKEILVPNLVRAQLNLKVVRDAFNAKVDRFLKGPLGTIAYINHREPIMGNYSEFKILFEQNTPVLRPLPLKTITSNAGFSFYHQPNPVLKQQRMRAFNAALSLEGSAASPFTETLDLSRITYSFVGSYERIFENSRKPGKKADIASVQFLMGFPLFKGMAVPFSLTYSNATETDRRRGWRANFGLKMDTDKLLELVRAASPR